MQQFNNVDVYKLAELRYGAKSQSHFPGPQLTNFNDFNNFCFNTVAEFYDPAIEPIQNTSEGTKCQIAAIKQMALNGREHPGLKLRLPVVLSRPQYFKDAYMATGNADEAYKIAVNSCIVNNSPGLEQASCIQRCGNARDALLLGRSHKQPAANASGKLNVPPMPADHRAHRLDSDTKKNIVDDLKTVAPGDDSGDVTAAPDDDSGDVTTAPGDDSGDVTAAPDDDSGDVTAAPDDDSGDLDDDSDDVTSVPGDDSGDVTAAPDDVRRRQITSRSQHLATYNTIAKVQRDGFEYTKNGNHMCGGIIFMIICLIAILLLIFAITNNRNTGVRVDNMIPNRSSGKRFQMNGRRSK